MKFNGYQEEAILEALDSAIPQIDSYELWYGYIQPFFNGVELNLNGAPKLADSSDELAHKMRELAVDFLLNRVRNYPVSYAEQEYILQNIPSVLLRELALMMGEAISAVLRALMRTSVSL